MLLAVKTAEVAPPAAFVVAVFTPPAKVPLAPLAGAVNVTRAPPTAFPLTSVTVTESGVAKALRIPTLCGVPLVAVMFGGGPATIPVTLRTRLFPGSERYRLPFWSPQTAGIN